jgi:hypothetical protein
VWFFIEDSKITGAPIRRGRGESVTRGDRRRRELKLRSPSPPLTGLVRIDGAMTHQAPVALDFVGALRVKNM